MITMKKSVLTAFITVVCATSSVMAADDNAITDGSVTFNGKVIAPACTLVAATKDSVVTLPDVSATKLQNNGQVSGVQTDVPIELKDCDITVTKNATFTFNGTADTTQITAFANQALYYPSSAEKIGQFSLPAVRMPYRALGSNLLRRFMQRTAFLPK